MFVSSRRGNDLLMRIVFSCFLWLFHRKISWKRGVDLVIIIIKYFKKRGVDLVIIVIKYYLKRESLSLLYQLTKKLKKEPNLWSWPDVPQSAWIPTRIKSITTFRFHKRVESFKQTNNFMEKGWLTMNSVKGSNP